VTEREERRRAILAASLPHVAFDGWTDRLFDRAAEDLGLAPSEVRRLFIGGAGELVGFFIAEADRRMMAALAERDLAATRVRDRIATAVRVRLEDALPHREAVRRALAYFAMPHHAGAGAASLYRTVDAIWRAAGDTATDVNFYTKRGLLAGVYSATLMFWLNDRSEGCEATWRFLDRRIDDVMRIQKARASLARRLPRADDVIAAVCRGVARRTRQGRGG
jgi:ubiquinone biosynthesis protein COQ9